MFIGHFGAGLALKKAAPQVSLGTLFLGAQFMDLLWPVLLLAGVEHAEIAPEAIGPPLRFTHYPYSHSLVMTLVWAALLGGGYFLLRRNRTGALVCAVAVVSHWVLDLLVHHPDLPLYPGGTHHVGLGLWSSGPIAHGVELACFGLGLWLYSRVTTPADRIGRFGLWALAASLLLIQAGNAVGAPPPHVAAVAWVGNAQWLFVLWGWWIDRHRRPTRPAG